jgi:hypothetical protein
LPFQPFARVSVREFASRSVPPLLVPPVGPNRYRLPASVLPRLRHCLESGRPDCHWVEAEVPGGGVLVAGGDVLVAALA